MLRPVRLIAALLTTLLLGMAHAQAPYPSKPLRVVVPYAPGGATDLIARAVAAKLGEVLGQPVLIDNKPGANSGIGAETVAKAPADGYTLFFTNDATFVLNPLLFTKLSYDMARDFVPVAFSGLSPIGLAIPASRPEKTLAEWVAWASKQKGKLNYASPGNGSVSHVYGFQVNEDFDIGATHVPYKGVSPALMDMVAGQVHFTMLDTFSLRPLLTKGDLRLLAVSGERRSKYLPNVPTFAELGHKGYERMGWTGYYAKAGTPAAILEQMAAAINKLNATPEWTEKRDQVWSDWRPYTTAEIADKVRSETETYARLIAKIGFYAD